MNLLYQCVVLPAGYCELAVPVCHDSADGTGSGSGGEGLCHLLHGCCCQPAGGRPQAPPAPSSAGTFLFSLDCIVSSFVLFLVFVLLLLFLGTAFLYHQMNLAMQPCPALAPGCLYSTLWQRLSLLIVGTVAYVHHVSA